VEVTVIYVGRLLAASASTLGHVYIMRPLKMNGHPIP
jgi:hypothetical protein